MCRAAASQDPSLPGARVDFGLGSKVGGLQLVWGAWRPAVCAPKDVFLKGSVAMYTGHFRLLTSASGPEILDLWGFNGPLYRKTHWHRWMASPLTFSS